MTSPIVRVEGLAWTAPGAQEPLWKEVCFEVEAGELVLLTGQSGSGKSTLLRCMVLLEERTAGQVFWHGEAVSASRVRQFRNRVVYVHQSPVAIAATVEENFAFARHVAKQLGTEGMSEEEQREVLAGFGLEKIDFSRRFEDFSVGEQQRLALVRCLSVRPEVLLLDEPTASLDDESAKRVESYIESVLSTGVAVVWVSHNREQRERLKGRVLDLDQWR